MITVKRRAVVSKEFIEAIKEIASQKLATFKELVEMSGEGYARRYKHDINYCLSILNKQDIPGKGLDLEVTNLRSMPFLSYGVDSHEGYGDFIYGQTTNLVCVSTNNNSQRWDIGSWMIVVPMDAFVTGSLLRIHLIPQKSPKIINRHPHHYAYDPNDDRFSGFINCHPLEAEPVFCWSGYGTPLPVAIKQGCVSETLRILHQFIISYNPSSPLRRINEMPHFEQLGAQA